MSKGYHFLSWGLKTYLQGNRMHFLLFKVSSTFLYRCIFYFVYLQPTSFWLLFFLRISETVTVKIRIKSKKEIILLFYLLLCRKIRIFCVIFLLYFCTKRPIKVVLAGFVTEVHIIIFILLHTSLRNKVNTNCWVIIIIVFMNISFIMKLAFKFIELSPSEEADIYLFIYLSLYSRNP